MRNYTSTICRLTIWQRAPADHLGSIETASCWVQSSIPQVGQEATTHPISSSPRVYEDHPISLSGFPLPQVNRVQCLEYYLQPVFDEDLKGLWTLTLEKAMDYHQLEICDMLLKTCYDHSPLSIGYVSIMIMKANAERASMMRLDMQVVTGGSARQWPTSPYVYGDDRRQADCVPVLCRIQGLG